MNSLKLYITGLCVAILPETRCFALKRRLYRWCGAQVGTNVRICSSAKILGNGRLTIGNNTWIGPQVLLVCSGSICIGSEVDIAPRVFIGTGSHEIDCEGAHVAGNGYNGDIVIGDGVWLCAGVMILPASSPGEKRVVGEKSVVAAGAVVVGDIPSHVIAGGVPAGIIKVLGVNE